MRALKFLTVLFRYEMVFDEDDDRGPRHSKRSRDHKAEQYDEKQNSKHRDSYKPKDQDERRRDTHDWQKRHERTKEHREDEGYVRRQRSPYRGGAKDYSEKNGLSDGREAADVTIQNSRDEREHKRRHGNDDGHKHRRDHREYEKNHGDDAGYGYKRDERKYEKRLVDDVGHRDRKNENEAKKKSGNEDLRGSHRDRHDVGDDNYGYKRRGEQRYSDKRSSKSDDLRDRVRRH